MKYIQLIVFCFVSLLFSTQAFSAADDQKGLNTPEAAPYGVFSTNTLYIMAAFPQEPMSTNESNWSDISNKVNSYFNDVSNGKVTLSPANETYGNNNGVIQVTYSYDYSPLIRSPKLIRDALIKADNYINYSQYDNNNDGHIDSNELAIVVIVSGKKSASNTGSATGLGTSYDTILDGVKIASFSSPQGFRGNSIVIITEFGSDNDPNSYVGNFGVIAHELGHSIFKVPDFYQGSYGLNMSGLMGRGLQGKLSSQTYAGEAPVMPSAWTQLKLGWVIAKEASGTESIVAMGSSSATSSNTVYKVSTDNPDEYYLIANLQNVGQNQGFFAPYSNPQGGLIIYHIDDLAPPYTNDTRAIIQPARPGIQSPSTIFSIINPQNLLWRSDSFSEFNKTSVPNSNSLIDGSPTGVSINSISDSGNIMTFTVGESNSTSIDNIVLNTPINGSWDSNTESVNRPPGRNAKFYSFTLSTATTVTIDLESATDAYLYLLNGVDIQGSIITFDDDGGDGRNSRITRLLTAGTYTVEATTYSANAVGDFTLQVSSDSSGSTIPEIISHANGSTLNGSTIDFSWISNGYNVSSYWIDVGSTPTSGDDIYSANLSSSTTSHSVSDLPTDGSTIYVRLYYNAAYDYVSYQFTTSGGGSNNTLPEITSPVDGGTLSGSTVNFSWISNGYNVSSYWIDVGSTPTSGDDIYSANLSSSTTSHSVTGLPTDGSTIYVRLYYNAAYDYVGYQFTTGN